MQEFTEVINLDDAVDFNNIDKVYYFINNGVDVNKKYKRDWTALHSAARYNRVEIAKILIAAGANVNSQNITGNTPLHIAVMQNDIVMIKLLLDSGANIDAENFDKQTPIYYASDWDNVEAAELLLENKSNVNSQDKGGNTPIHRAKKVPMAALLLYYGANPDIINIGGYSAKKLAALSRNIDLMRLFKMIPDNPPKVEIHEAIKNKDLKRVVDLIQDKKNLNSRDIYSNTPLHVAVWAGVSEIINVLIENGADINAKNIFSDKPIDLVLFHSKQRIEPNTIKRLKKGE